MCEKVNPQQKGKISESDLKHNRKYILKKKYLVPNKIIKELQKWNNNTEYRNQNKI